MPAPPYALTPTAAAARMLAFAMFFSKEANS